MLELLKLDFEHFFGIWVLKFEIPEFNDIPPNIVEAGSSPLRCSPWN